MAPRICAGMYQSIRSACPVMRTEATVNAGFKWASVSPIEIATATPENTAKPQPAVMATHPAFSAFDLERRTPPTTPFPKRIKMAVPTNSPITAALSVIEIDLPDVLRCQLIVLGELILLPRLALSQLCSQQHGYERGSLYARFCMEKKRPCSASQDVFDRPSHFLACCPEYFHSAKWQLRMDRIEQICFAL